MECKHQYCFSYHTGIGAKSRTVKSLGGKPVKTKPLTFGFRCRKCGDAVERKATPGERKFHATLRQPGYNVHKVWHAFTAEFKNDNGTAYLSLGFDLQEKVEKWAEAYPQDVRLVGVDDASFSSSLLVLIEHKTEKMYMGTTVVYIPQCTGESPIEFFLYGSHRQGLIAALASIQAQAEPIEAKERAENMKRVRLIQKNLCHPAVI